MKNNTPESMLRLECAEARQSQSAPRLGVRPWPDRAFFRPRWIWLPVAIALGVALLNGPATGQSLYPTLELGIQRSTNRLVVINWSPPQATLQYLWPVTSTFADVVGATTPYRVDTRLQPAGVYRVSLPTNSPTLFMWSDPQTGPGNLVFDWYPRNWQFQESTNFQQWRSPTNVPPTGRYRRSAPLEPVPGSVKAGMRAFRIVSPVQLAAALGQVYSVNIVGYANFVFQVGRFNAFSFMFAQTDSKLNTLLPLPPEAEGTALMFFNPATQSYDPPNTFLGGGVGWVDDQGQPAVKAPGQSACVIIPQTTEPPLTVTTLGEVPQGTLRRVLPPGASMNGPLAPIGGGITTIHQLHARDGDQVLLFNSSTQNFDDAYEWFGTEWSPAEPVIRPGDAFLFLNSNGPLEWSRSFIVNP